MVKADIPAHSRDSRESSPDKVSTDSGESLVSYSPDSSTTTISSTRESSPDYRSAKHFKPQ